MKKNTKLRSEKGSITLYVLLSILFFIIILVGLYVNSNNKISKQKKEIEDIQKSYQKEDINSIYEKALEKNNKLSDIVKIGDYVQYIPDVVSTTNTNYKQLITDLETYSGSSANTASTLIQESLNWRVLDVENGKVRLISEKPTTSTIELSGYNGYNNAVYLLDNTCRTLYNSEEYSEKVQNLKIEDIEKYIKEKDYSTFTSDYGKTFSPTNKYYPSIFIKEKDQTITTSDGTIQPEQRINLSEQNETINQIKINEATSWTVKYTYWTKDMTIDDFTDSIYYNLFINNGSNFVPYWMSSRCVYTDFENTLFIVSVAGNSHVGARTLYYSYNDSKKYGDPFRPVITLKSDVLVDSIKSGDGSEATKAWILK